MTNLLNLKFKFKLAKYSISERDKDGAWGVTAKSRKRISDWTPRADVPPVPISPVDGWTRAWLAKRPGVYAGEDDNTLTVYRPRTGKIHAGDDRTFEWAWLIATKELRALLRHDQINLSTIAKHGCGKSKWWATFRRYVDDIYK